jgi:putative phosphoesterase
MLIGIISDTHDNANNMIKAFDIFNNKKVDIILHLGDWVSPFMLRFCKYSNTKIISIFGNNEHDRYRYPEKVKLFEVNVEFVGETAELEFEDKKLFLCHGKNKEEIISAISSKKYDLVLSGDSHLSKIEHIEKTIHVNPGSTCGIKNEDTNHELTIALYNTNNNKAEIIKFK